MNNLRNRVTLIGRLGKEPEIRTIEGNRKVARVTLATNEEYTGKDGVKIKDTQWHNLVAWGNLAEKCEKSLTKGKEIAVEGKLTYKMWDDKEGKTHYMTEINISELLFFSSKPE